MKKYFKNKYKYGNRQGKRRYNKGRMTAVFQNK